MSHTEALGNLDVTRTDRALARSIVLLFEGHLFARLAATLGRLASASVVFMGSEAAGQTNAIWYSLIESRRRRIDPWKYLVWIFEELPKVKVTVDTFASYTPKAYAKTLSQLRIKKTP